MAKCTSVAWLGLEQHQLRLIYSAATFAERKATMVPRETAPLLIAAGICYQCGPVLFHNPVRSG